MKKRRLAILLALLLLLTACGGGGGGGEGKEPEGGESATFSDVDQLVEITVTDGQGELRLNLDRWDELFGIRDFDPDFYDADALEEGPFPLTLTSGPIATVAIAQLTNMGSYGPGLPYVAAVFLTREGSVEYLFIDPYDSVDYSHLGGEYADYQRFPMDGKLGHWEAFSFLLLADETEGIGGQAIHLVDENGITHDFYYLLQEDRITSQIWVMPMEEPDAAGESDNFYLTFLSNGLFEFNLERGIPYEPFSSSDTYEMWEGTASLVTSPDDSYYPMGVLLYEMELAWWIGDEEEGYSYAPERELAGSYRAFIDEEGRLVLLHNDGDPLYPYDTSLDHFVFDGYDLWYLDE